jgi:hypothetical protein
MKVNLPCDQRIIEHRLAIPVVLGLVDGLIRSSSVDFTEGTQQNLEEVFGELVVDLGAIV